MAILQKSLVEMAIKLAITVWAPARKDGPMQGVTDLPDPASKEGKILARTLLLNETILAQAHYILRVLAQPSLHFYLIATDLRVIIVKPVDPPTSFFFRPEVKCYTYPYEDIVSVEMQDVTFSWSKSMALAGYVHLHMREDQDYQINWEKLTIEKKKPAGFLWQPNVVHYSLSQESKEAFRHVVDVINQRRALVQSPRFSIPSLSTIPEQIKQLASLRDAGILTNEEFEKKKAELLLRM
jgi:hypothetical protein